MSGDITPEMWTEYKETRDRAIFEKIVTFYQPLVLYVARMVHSSIPQHVDRDDLVSYGNMGLMDAIKSYDMSRGVKFQTFSMLRIRGAMIDGLRVMDWVPRSVRAKARVVDKASVALERELGRPPTSEELSLATGLTERELAQLNQESVSANFIPLDALTSIGSTGDHITEAEMLEDTQADRPDDMAMLNETKFLLAQAVGRLPEHLRIVLALYFYHGQNFAGVAEVLGITESRVCQLYQQAVTTLADPLRLGRSTAT